MSRPSPPSSSRGRPHPLAHRCRATEQPVVARAAIEEVTCRCRPPSVSVPPKPKMTSLPAWPFSTSLPISSAGLPMLGPPLITSSKTSADPAIAAVGSEDLGHGCPPGATSISCALPAPIQCWSHSKVNKPQTARRHSAVDPGRQDDRGQCPLDAFDVADAVDQPVEFADRARPRRWRSGRSCRSPNAACAPPGWRAAPPDRAARSWAAMRDQHMRADQPALDLVRQPHAVAGDDAAALQPLDPACTVVRDSPSRRASTAVGARAFSLSMASSVRSVSSIVISSRQLRRFRRQSTCKSSLCQLPIDRSCPSELAHQA